MDPALDDWEAPAPLYPALKLVLWFSLAVCGDEATKALLKAVAAAHAPMPATAMLAD